MASEIQSPIAIIGMACRFPGAADEHAYWDLIANGGCAVTETPADRWPVADLYDSHVGAAGKVSTRHGGFLDRYAHFDADFFGIHAREARAMDPQQRVLLELTWHALENAAIDPRSLAGARAGVFIGASTWDYSKLMNRDLHVLDAYCGTGAVLSVIANRISYLLDLHGPSMVVDTACSSSLTALHLAAQSLERGECDLALVGAVNVMVSPETTITLSAAGSMSPSGRCHSFAACADGIVRSEGAGVIVLRRLADAQAEADPILGIVRGSALNQDGRTNGLTSPNVFAQQSLIRDALTRAGVSPSEPSYVEAHGTGTLLGDPIEVRALQEVLQEGRDAARPCFVGAVKANIGHCEAAAGLAGVIKILLAFRHEQIPPQPPAEAVNPHVAALLKQGPLQLATQGRPWLRGQHPSRIAAVSTLSFGGSNAHVLLQEPPLDTQPASQPQPTYHVLKLSAESPSALAELASSYRTALLACADDPAMVADFCYTANCFRSELRYRAVVSGTSAAELANALAADLQRSAAPKRPKLALWLPELERSPVWLATGRALSAVEPVFREAFERGLALMPESEPMGRTALANAADGRVIASCGVALAGVGGAAAVSFSPDGYALQYALGRVIVSWGVAPAFVSGSGGGAAIAAAISGERALDQTLDEARVPSTPVELPAAAQLDTVLVLGPSVESLPKHADSRCVPLLATEPAQARAQLYRALHALFAGGHKLDWRSFYAGQTRRRIRIPGCPFQGPRLWLPFTRRPIAMSVLPTGEHRPTRRAGLDVQALEHPLLGACVTLAGEDQLVLTGRLAREEQPWLADHRIDGTAVVSSTTLLELAMFSARKAGLSAVRTLAIEALFPLPAHGGVQVQVVLADSPEPGCRSVRVFARAESDDPTRSWLRCASGELGDAPGELDECSAMSIDDAQAIALDDVYRALANAGLTYGDSFRGLVSAELSSSARHSPSQIQQTNSPVRVPVHEPPAQRQTWDAELALPEQALADVEAYDLHPALLDSALRLYTAQQRGPHGGPDEHESQLARGAVDHAHPDLRASHLSPDESERPSAALPRLFCGVRVRAPGAARVRATITSGPFGVELQLRDEQGQRIGQIDSVGFGALRVVELAASSGDGLPADHGEHAGRARALHVVEPAATSGRATSGARAPRANSAAVTAFKARLAALPAADRELVLLEAVIEAISSVLGVSTYELDPDRPLAELGLDSRMAVELRNQFRGLTGLKLSASMLFDHPTPVALARLLTGMLFDGARATASNSHDGALSEQIRAIPIARLREAGLLDALLQLAISPSRHAHDHDQDHDALTRIDAMSPEELLQRARSTSAL
ncbi:MAG TPA: beta-ketoacyl synthase N-terminal-like domain-containing protein [Polyangiales bacterium]|nr:beta-ketoacyl synthase N-terminal-like domain-containing protein [Polyangiales bacterium]